MSEKHSEASKKRWAGVPADKRTEIMRQRAFQKNAKMNKGELHDQAMRLVEARKQKRLSIKKR